jgi:hypothetical protein
MSKLEALEDISWAITTIFCRQLKCSPEDIPQDWFLHLRHSSRVKEWASCARSQCIRKGSVRLAAGKEQHRQHMTNTMRGHTVTERVVGVMSRFEPIMDSIFYYLVWMPAGCPALE